MIPATLDRDGAAPVADLVRSAGRAFAIRSAALSLAAERADRQVAGWRGLAADAADEVRGGLVTRVLLASRAHDEAAYTLQACADALDEAVALRRRAEALMQQDAKEQSAAAAAREALRAATVTGPPLPSYTWTDASPLLVAARRLEAEATAMADDAVRRASARLRELLPPPAPAPAPVPRLDALDQVVGFGRGVWGTVRTVGKIGELIDPWIALQYRSQWWSDVRQIGSGVAGAVQHPRAALGAALGTDQLARGEYGEWLGGMLAGMALPPGRISRVGRVGRVAGVGERLALRAVDAGGPVLARVGLVLPRGFPLLIKDLEPARRRHILDGDGPNKGGGHRAGTGKAGKTEFPPDWTDDDIIERVMRTAMNPDRVARDKNDRFVALADVEGVTVKVVLESDGRIVTSYPLPGGAGVIDNPRVKRGG